MANTCQQRPLEFYIPRDAIPMGQSDGHLHQHPRPLSTTMAPHPTSTTCTSSSNASTSIGHMGGGTNASHMGSASRMGGTTSAGHMCSTSRMDSGTTATPFLYSGNEGTRTSRVAATVPSTTSTGALPPELSDTALTTKLPCQHQREGTNL